MGKKVRADASQTAETAERKVKAETELYSPVKSWLEEKGYTVRGEVRGCDIVAVKDDESWPVVIELKKRFNLSLFLQAVERFRLSPYVYVAAERTSGRNAFSIGELTRLCRLIGVGLITVRLYKRKPALVEVHCDPSGDVGASPGKPGKRTAKLLTEFHGRSGDYNAGGITGRKLVTAYREKALRIAEALHTYGPLAPRQVRDLIASDKAAAMLQRNVYGWYRRIERGVYGLTPEGAAALETFAEVLETASVARR